MKLFFFNQTQFLLLSFAFGFAVGLWFEFFRILRRAFRHGAAAVALEDFVFFAVTAVLYWFLCFGAALGRLRWFSFFALVLGFLVYLMSLGRLLCALSGAIIAFVKRIVRLAVRVAAIPLRALKIALVRPVRRLCAVVRGRIVRLRRARQLKRFLRAASRGFR